MSFRVIKGTFHVVGYSPDGDSVRFKALDDANWLLLDGKVRLNSKMHAQLRIEAIDTLETHYNSQHQPVEFADAATTKLFSYLKISNVVWNASRSKVVSAEDGTPGFIIARMAEKYGRPVSFVFSGDQGFQDGAEIFVDKKLTRKSVNYKMLRDGLAYPTFYDGLFYDLREQFSSQTQKARKKKKGLWVADTTNKYIQITGLADVVDQDVLLPKLFRRIVTFLQQHDGFDAEQFVAFLAKEPEEVFILNKLHFTHFDNLINVDENGRIKLSEKPEELIFLG
jgi:endonuclease YncB( thermonuclease family)